MRIFEGVSIPSAMAEVLGPVLDPVRPHLETGLARLPAPPPLRWATGDAGGFRRLEGSAALLDEGLLTEGAVRHPREPELPGQPGLDRWRRALASVLEAVALAVLRETLGADPQGSWIGEGAAAWLAHLALPDLGLALPDLALAASEGDLVAHPRAGAVAYHHAAATVEETLSLARRWWTEPPGADAFLEIARHALEPGRLPLSGEVVRARGLLPRLGPWSFAWFTWSGGDRGGRLEIEGEGAVSADWVAAGEDVRAIAASVSGIALGFTAGFPVGRWRFASGRGMGQLLGARGVDFVFADDGELQILLADAFVGPLPALPIAERVGTSGVIRGRWQVCGPQEIAFVDLVPLNLVVQGRQEGDPLPASLGLADSLGYLEQGRWRFEEVDGELRLAGGILDLPVELRLVRDRA